MLICIYCSFLPFCTFVVVSLVIITCSGGLVDRSQDQSKKICLQICTSGTVHVATSKLIVVTTKVIDFSIT